MRLNLWSGRVSGWISKDERQKQQKQKKGLPTYLSPCSPLSCRGLLVIGGNGVATLLPLSIPFPSLADGIQSKLALALPSLVGQAITLAREPYLRRIGRFPSAPWNCWCTWCLGPFLIGLVRGIFRNLHTLRSTQLQNLNRNKAINQSSATESVGLSLRSTRQDEWKQDEVMRDIQNGNKPGLEFVKSKRLYFISILTSTILKSD